VTLLAIAAFKARLVVLDYLGFRDAPGPWRAILTTWIVVLALLSAASSIIGLLS
jgi:ABC-type nickel/cobalt efflux system permease component RcnA